MNHVVLVYQHETRTLRLYVDATLIYERHGMDMEQDWSIEYPNFSAVLAAEEREAEQAERKGEAAE